MSYYSVPLKNNNNNNNKTFLPQQQQQGRVDIINNNNHHFITNNNHKKPVPLPPLPPPPPLPPSSQYYEYEEIDNLSLPPPPPPIVVPVNYGSSDSSSSSLYQNISNLRNSNNNLKNQQNFPLPPPSTELDSKSIIQQQQKLSDYINNNNADADSDERRENTYANLLNHFNGLALKHQKNQNHGQNPKSAIISTSIANNNNNGNKSSDPYYSNLDQIKIINNNNNFNHHQTKRSPIIDKNQNIYDQIATTTTATAATSGGNRIKSNQQSSIYANLIPQQQQQQPIPPQPNPKPNIKGNYLRFNRSNTNSKQQEEEVDHLTDLLVKSMENSEEPDFFGICNKCNQKVVGEGSGCTAMEMVFHIHCFTCHVCNKELRGKPFYAMENNPHCEDCYLNSLEKCAVCQKPIMDRILRATGKPYHPSCFTCVVCQKCLDGIPFTVDASNQIHCIDCFHGKFAPRCSVCSNPIIPEPGKTETVRVVALDKSFHVSCYKCEDCDLLLSSEVEGRGCYPLDNHILCRNCNAKRVQAITS